MPLRRIVAATSDTDEGRAAVQTATCLGQRFQSKVIVLAVADEPLQENGLARLTRSLRETVARQLQTVQRPHPAVHFAVQFGLPGVEIGRFAESNNADLVVVGRREHATPKSGQGDTADAVSRRSRVPSLLVKPGQTRFDHLLIALDGTERGLAVLQGGVEFARGTRARVRTVTVEPAARAGQDSWVHMARTERVSDAVSQMRRSGVLEPEQWNVDPAQRPPPVLVRHGPVVDELLSEVETGATDLLVFGCHRGGPSAASDLCNIPRQLMQRSPVALLAIPL